MGVGSDGQETDHLKRSNYTAARAGLESRPAIICAQGERATRRFIEFFTATIRNRNVRMASARAKMPLRSVRKHHPGLEDIEPIAIAAYIDASPCWRP